MDATKHITLDHMLDLPALAAPPGLTHNFVNPSDMKTGYYIALILSLTVSFLVVCMRMWTKAHLIQKFGREDWLCLLAFTLFSGYCAYVFYFLKGSSVGVHQWNVQLKSLPNHFYHVRVGSATYCFVVLAIKNAILLDFLRIFSPGRRDNTFWIYHILIWLNFLFYVIVSFFFIFPCQPIQKFWKPWINGRCLDIPRINIAGACYNIASDLSILILPQKVIWSLQISFKRRVGVSAIFLAGLFACFTSLIRLYYSIQIVKTQDATYNIAFSGFWSLGEIASGFIAMCLPVSPRFFQSLKEIAKPSWISISGPFFRQSSKTEGYLSQSNLPRRLPKESTFGPRNKHCHPIARSVGSVSDDYTPTDRPSSSTKLESDNSHIIR